MQWSLRRVSVVAVVMLVAAGCAPKTRYTWNDYDNKLYRHYKEPAKYDEFVDKLKEVIAEGEESGKVPPGIYAEYGFALFEKGDFPQAAKYFKLESGKWPESRVLMSKMINNAEVRGNQKKQVNQPDVSAKPEGGAPNASGASEVAR
jgi:hypothetical protein